MVGARLLEGGLGKRRARRRVRARQMKCAQLRVLLRSMGDAQEVVEGEPHCLVLRLPLPLRVEGVRLPVQHLKAGGLVAAVEGGQHC
jgi:hypothetical protein